MTASELYEAGKLQDAIDEQVQVVKKSPTDEGKRVFLFELIAFSGDLDRAARQLQSVQVEDPQKQVAQQTYLNLLEAERKRRRVFLNEAAPQFFVPPPPHVTKRLEALAQARSAEPGSAAELWRSAEEATPVVAGELNGKAVDVLRDLDDRFGTVLEVILHGEYFWVALEQVESISMNAPRFPRDLLWVPARITVRDGASGDVFLPALYPSTHEQTDDLLRLGRATEWQSVEGGPVHGSGARMYLAGEESVGLLEWRQLSLTAP